MDDPNEFTSHPFIYADEDHHLVEAQPLVATTKPLLLDSSGLSNATRASHHLGSRGNGHWGGMCGRVGWIGDTLNTVRFVTQPLMPEALDQMTLVRPREHREVLGAIALPLAIAATAMGVFN